MSSDERHHYTDEPPVPPQVESLEERDVPVVTRAEQELTADEKQWAMLCHLSALLALVIGVGLIGPLVCWLIKKDTSRFVDAHGKESVNFQINMLIYVLISIPVGIVTCGFGFILTAALGIYGIIMPIIAGMKANSGETYQYPYTFRLIN
jgi:uncharacterized Tic20 family protein